MVVITIFGVTIGGRYVDGGDVGGETARSLFSLGSSNGSAGTGYSYPDLVAGTLVVLAVVVGLRVVVVVVVVLGIVVVVFGVVIGRGVVLGLGVVIGDGVTIGLGVVGV